MSSAACGRCTSGPLQSGQTRISSSLGSTKLLLQPSAERGIERSAHREHPEVRLREALAFYRVLLGHHDRGLVAEFEIRGAERVVVRKGMRQRLHAETRELKEKSLGIADAVDRVHRLAGEGFRRAYVARVGEAHELLAF